MHGRAFAYWIVLGVVATVVAGAATHNLLLVAVGPVAVAAIALAVSFATADRQAELDFFAGYAATRGFDYVRGRRQVRETRHFTLCVIDIEAGITLFPGLFLCRRRGIFGRLDGHDWLSHRNRHKVELESAALCERYDLWVDDDQDELLLRELFVPSFEVLLAEHPLQACFEYRAGTLVVYVERVISDEGHLDWMREVSAAIAGRFGAEIKEQPRVA